MIARWPRATGLFLLLGIHDCGSVAVTERLQRKSADLAALAALVIRW